MHWKNLKQIPITRDLIDRQLQDRSDAQSFELEESIQSKIDRLLALKKPTILGHLSN